MDLSEKTICEVSAKVLTTQFNLFIEILWQVTCNLHVTSNL